MRGSHVVVPPSYGTASEGLCIWFLRAGVTPSRLKARHPGSDRPLGIVAGRIGFEIDGSVSGFFVAAVGVLICRARPFRIATKTKFVNANDFVRFNF
jgi:hypothetical protein